MQSIRDVGGQAAIPAPVGVGQVNPAQDPEFLDARDVQARFGLKRSLLYALLADGSIRGVSLKRPGRLRGKRLFYVASVRAFLHNQMEGTGK